jgi:hypothetical protein
MDVDTNYIKEFDARVDAQRAQAKAKLKLAIESQDAEQIASAQDELTRLSVEKEKARIVMSEREAARKSFEEQQKAQAVQKAPQQPITPSTKAKSWAEKNEWFGNDKYMTNSAFMLHEDLVSQGFDAESDEYYNEVDKRMRDLYPHKFAKSQETEVTEENRKPVQTVASAGRKQSGRRTVRLTKSQVAIAKKLGVPLEEYAKYVKEV